ncbi:hypothetical protein ACFSKM_06530 [Ancylobacter dichloromethanicus]
MPRPADFHARAIEVLHDANEAAWRESDPEEGCAISPMPRAVCSAIRTR